jgi:hypothetical protein
MDLNCNKPEDYRCATCKCAVDPADARWRMGRDGWEHNCPDQYPIVGHSPSERVPVEAAAS